MPRGSVLHTPSCRQTLVVTSVIHNIDSPALMLQPVNRAGAGPRRSRRATVGQLSGFHLAADCSSTTVPVDGRR